MQAPVALFVQRSTMRSIVLLAVLLLQKEAHGFCSWPCFMQGKSFYNDRSETDITFYSAYQIVIKPKDSEPIYGECIQSHGRYILYRRLQDGDKDLYRCFKFNNDGDVGFVVFKSTLDPMERPPADFCEFCSDDNIDSTPDVWFDKELTRMGCNVPKNCPSKSSANLPCTGCGADNIDDGYCCADTSTVGYGYDLNYGMSVIEVADKSHQKHSGDKKENKRTKGSKDKRRYQKH